MGVKLFFLLSLAACTAQAIQLTKENNLAQAADLQKQLQSLTHSALSLGSAEVRQHVLDEIIDSPKAAVLRVAQLLLTKSNAEVSEVLDEFNAGLGFQLLVIQGEYVTLDALAFEKMLSQKASAISRALYPDDYYQSLILYGALQKKILALSPEMRTVIQTAKVPVSKLSKALTTRGFARGGLSEIQAKSVLDQLISAVEIAACNVVVSDIYDQVNSTLQSCITYLGTITVETTDSSIWESIVVVVVNLVVDLGESLVEYANSLAASYASSVCDDLFSSSSDSDSRKRRDLSAAVDVGQVALINRNILTDLVDLVWQLLAPILNNVAKLAVQMVADAVTSEVDGIVSSAVLAANDYIDDILS
ncbi:uncharacterized protein LOC109543280 [Dendroctonus ponderosae]|uniref:Uncharacterized protein n=1 Tax=Dendroctonus ponderosae TaxID=77166 RepID=U4UVT9_DENPD|nr:uncharacterized protein LOC109543280 [Dendroctonus ponderosae]ERL94351.1 hypothetical protein D910_11632 [Dendroctonus ponderosae]KAH1008676.1 hypothetical protein HUJ05_009211 [Dendroctonus ponderosae]